jgi:hypothetical protein
MNKALNLVFQERQPVAELQLAAQRDNRHLTRRSLVNRHLKNPFKI